MAGFTERRKSTQTNRLLDENTSELKPHDNTTSEKPTQPTATPPPSQPSAQKRGATTAMARITNTKELADQIQTLTLEAQTKPTRSGSADNFKTVMGIGQGACGKVLMVQQLSTGEYYAMKRLRKSKLAQSPQEERDILVMNSHPFLVSLKYAFQTERHLYMVMDIHNGGDLFTNLDRRLRRYRRGFDIPDARFYAAELLCAIAHLHQNGVAYRDLKPENILIGTDGHLRLTDFGLSTICNGRRLTTFVGTPEYLAPEEIKSWCRRQRKEKDNGYDGYAADWWSLGILIYEMVVGIGPFYEEQQPNETKKQCYTRIYNNIFRKKIVFPRKLNVDPDTRNVVKALLNRDPRRRLGSANGVGDLMAHPWFKTIDFGKLQRKEITPSMVPGGDSSTTDHFEDNFVESDEEDDEVGKHFEGFDYAWDDPGGKLKNPDGLAEEFGGAAQSIDINPTMALGRSFRIARRYSKSVLLSPHLKPILSPRYSSNT